MAKAKTKNQHVIPYRDKWAVRGEGNDRPTSIHNTQGEAIEAAREIAVNQRSNLIIHRTDGRIRERDSYSNDPLPPRSLRKVLFPATRSVTGKSRIRKAVKEVISESRRSSAEALHVVPHNGSWAIRGEGNRRARSTHHTQSEAIQTAKEIARKRGADVFVYRPDGRIRDRDSFARDPNPPRDRKQ